MANQKKISELPIINALSGSAVSVIPVVVGGTTNQIPAERFSEFVNAYNATTSSNTFIGDQTITGDLTITGDIRAERYYIENISSSVIYESGSTLFGNSGDDTHTFTGSILLNGSALGQGELNSQTASQDTLNDSLGLITSSIYSEITSFDNVFTAVSAVTGAFAIELGSIDSHILGVSIYTSSNELLIDGVRGEINGLEAYTASLKGEAIVSSSTQITNYHKFAETASANTFYGTQTVSGSVNINGGQFSIISGSADLTSSIGFKPVDYDLFQGASVFEVRHINNIYPEELALKLSVSDTSGTVFFEKNGSVYNVLSVGGNSNNLFISRNTRLLGTGLTIDNELLVKQNTQLTGSLIVLSGITGSILATNGVVSSSNQLFELNSQTASQDGVNLGISSVTGSLIGITNGLMAFTASLDSGYATDAQLYQLYQATRSLELQTGSQNSINSGISAVTGAFATELGSIDSHILKQATQTGSQDLVNLAISTFTGSQNVINTSVDSHILTQATQTGSQDLVNLGISTYTGSQNVINSSVDSHILKQATQTGSQDLVNLGISSVTGSLIGITNGLMAFTAALDSTYATDAQLYQLYQATRSLEIQTGSQNSINSGISAVTGAFATELGSIDSHILGVSNQTASQDLVNLAISTFTGSQNVINTSVDAHILGVSTYTSSQNVINSSVDAHILGVSTYTGSNELWKDGIRGEVNGLEAYTASLKNAFVIDGSNDVYFSGKITAEEFHTTFTSSSVLYQSGSSKFGDSVDDKHEFTGSIYSTGTITSTGDLVANAGSSAAVYVYNSNSLRGKLSMTGNEGDLTLYNSAATPKVYLSSYYDSYFNAGNVSIGKQIPGAPLDVNGNVLVTGSLSQLGDGFRINRTTSGEPYIFFVKNGTNRGSIYGGNATDGLRFYSGDSDLTLTLSGNASARFEGAVTASQGMIVSGTNYAFKSGGGGAAHQTLVGQCTAEASTVAKKIAFVGYTHAIRISIWASQDASNGATANADFTTMYGSSNGGVTYSAALGNVSAISVAYNNSGSPAYTIDVTLTYTGTAPTINYSIVGISQDAMYTIA